MKNGIIEINDFVPISVCKKICEMTDESEETINQQGDRTYFQSDKIHCIELDMYKMTQRPYGQAGGQNHEMWSRMLSKFKTGILTAYKKYCESLNIEPEENITIEPPKIHRYDPRFGKHIPTLFSEKRIASVFMYLNDVKMGSLKFENGTSIKPKTGKVVVFPATKEYMFEDKPSQDYMKYAIKCYIIRK